MSSFHIPTAGSTRNRKPMLRRIISATAGVELV
jgi:hypothetical protein